MHNNFTDYSLFGHKNLEVFAVSMIPQHIRMNYPNFVKFFTLFLEKTSKEREGTEFIHNMLAYANVDETSAFFLEEFCHNFLKELNYLPQVNKRTLVKWIKQWYEATGSEQSFRFLFRVLYNEDVEFYYPSIDMLRVSDGKWVLEMVLTIVRDRSDWDDDTREEKVGINPPTDEEYLDMVGTVIEGSTSKAKALVERVEFDEIWIDHDDIESTDREHVDLVKIYVNDFSKTNPVSNFIPSDKIICTTLSDQTKQFSLPLSYVISRVDVQDGVDIGSYYNEGDTVAIDHPLGAGCLAVVESVSTGSFVDFIIVDGGINYNVGERIELRDGYGYGCYAYISRVDKYGAIKAVKFVSGGEGYMKYPDIIYESKTGSGALLVPVPKNVGGIKSIKIINPGLEYRDITWADIKACFQNLITITSTSPSGYCRNVPREDVGYDGTLADADKVEKNGLRELSFTELNQTDKDYLYEKVFNIRKIYTFPIKFEKLAIKEKAVSNVSISFYREANNNTPLLSRNETILSETSKGVYAKGRIKRIDNEHGHMIVEQIGSEQFLNVGEIIGNESSSTGNIIIKADTVSFDIETGPVAPVPGYYRDRDSWIGSEKKIQDSYFYQVFSYVLKTQIPKEKWKTDVQNAVHPSGLIVFGMDEEEDRHGHSYGGNEVSTEKDVCSISRAFITDPNVSTMYRLDLTTGQKSKLYE